MGDQIAVAAYGDTVDEIIRLDAKNEDGLKAKYVKLRREHVERQTVAKVRQDVSAATKRGDKKGAVKVVADAIKKLKPTGTLAQELHFLKSLVLFQSDDKPAAKASFLKAKAAAPETKTAQRIDKILSQYFKGVE